MSNACIILALPLQKLSISASDVELVAADTERSHYGTTYTKVKEIFISFPGEYRITWDMKTDNVAGQARGKIYKNGVAFGTEQTTNSLTYVNQSDDLAFAAGDLLQLYIYNSGGTTTTYIENHKLKGTAGTVAGVVLTD